MSKEYDFHVSTGKYKKVLVSDGNDYVQIFNDVEAISNFNVRIIVNDSRFNRDQLVALDTSDKGVEMLYQALGNFLGK